jgi:hypothetical protein
MGSLVEMCDEMERHGLVDCKMGIWEEQIIHLFLECLNILVLVT